MNRLETSRVYLSSDRVRSPPADEAKSFLTLLSHRMVAAGGITVASVQAALAGVADLRS